MQPSSAGTFDSATFRRLLLKPAIDFGAHRLPPPLGATYEEREARSRAMLSRVLNLGTTVAVVGSGCSRPLGYPSWRELAGEVVSLTLEVLENAETRAGSRMKARIERFRSQLSSAASPSEESLMFYIGACEKALALEQRGASAYAEYLSRRFSAASPASGAANPHEALLELPITRFMTTNYDGEIERALEKRRGIPRSRFGIGSRHDPSHLSFTQHRRHLEQLARFALARLSGEGSRVFHCHGRYDDPDSIIASEADYQRWYVADSAGMGLAFRQTIRLLLESNPLLFVGYGLRDYDLLQPLRHLGAIDPESKDMRPCFALLPADEEDAHAHEALFERYGIHVISYRRPDEDTPQAWGLALCDALDGIRQDWSRAGTEWLEKPAPRQVPVIAEVPEPCLVTRFDRSHLETTEAIAVRDRSGDILAAIEDGARIVGLIGPSGSGKSWNAVHLIAELERTGADFAGYFLWNAHYENEAVTALDRALAYLDPERRSRGTRRRRLLECLQSARYLIVLDGCDRLLLPGVEAGAGRLYSAWFRELLRAAADRSSRSTLVLAGRLWPHVLDDLPAGEREGVVRLSLGRVMTSDLRKSPPFGSPDRAEVSILCSLLDGHGYGLLLAARYLGGDPESAGERLRELHRALSAERSPKNRLDVMIRLTLDRVERETTGRGADLLKRLALFTSPFSEPTLRICYRQSVRRSAAVPPLERLRRQLVEACLLERAVTLPAREGSAAWIVHPSVRAYLLGKRSADAFPSFIPSGFTSGGAGTAPASADWARTVESLLEALFAAADAAAESGGLAEAREICRDAYALLRSQMESNTAPRWVSYAGYVRHGIRLAMLAKRVAPRRWSFGARDDLERLEHADGPLFIGELAWLYNDTGLALFSEGSLPDAYAVWEQGYEIHRLLEGVDTPGELLLESHLNLTHAFIELGQLASAREYLEEAERIDSRLDSPPFAARIFGFKGLLEHLQGNLETADRFYGVAIRKLKRAGNLRGESFFMGRRAALAILLGDLEQARILSASSQAVAQTGGYPDLVAYARIPGALVLAASGDLPMARQEHNATLREAQRIGMRGLEAVARGFLSRLALKQGDAEGARSLAMEALRSANELGLGLVLTRSLIALALATFAIGQRDLGIAYLEIARREATRQQYWLRIREIEDCLKEQGVASDRVPGARETGRHS